MKKIVVIGGGTGTSVVLSGLKKYEDLDISVIVNMTDDGGSNAIVRDEFGVLPLSDLRKSVIALADESYNDILRELFVYRFHEGNGLKGHTLGNLLMLAMVDISGSEQEAVRVLEELFSTKGRIFLVTTDDVRLVAQYEDGKRVVGEHLIDEICEDRRIESFGLDSTAKISKSAEEEILNADYIVIGPGDIYTSILACIVVNGVAEAIQRSKGKLIFITNLMTKIGQTRGLSHSKVAGLVEEYIGRKMNYILINNGDISKELIKRYEEDGESLMEDDMFNDTRVIRKDIVANTEYIKDRGDALRRSLVRHDPEKLSKILYEIFRGKVKGFILSLLSRFY